MKIIISPTKQMRSDCSRPYHNLPEMLSMTEIILDKLRTMSPIELQKLWGCSDKLVMENLERLESIDLYNNLSPALFSYEGIAFQYMSPDTLSEDALIYLNENLRILSGFYGILRPDDGISPYRLEMQAKLKTSNASNLYKFWGSSLREKLDPEPCEIINLASKEYSDCISKHLYPDDRLIECVFAELQSGKLVQKGVYAKMARGAMVHYLADNYINDPEAMRNFSAFGFCYDNGRSSHSTYVFVSDGLKH